MNPDEIKLRLVRHGLVVFLLGLVSGLAMTTVADAFANLRLALSSHLVGVTGGIFLVIAGLLVDRVHMHPRLLKATTWLALYGGYGNWLGTMLGAIFGTRTLTAVAGEGYAGAAWQEAVVGILLTTAGMSTMATCLLLLWGLRPRNRDKP